MKPTSVFRNTKLCSRMLLVGLVLFCLQEIAFAQKGDNPRRDEQRENERVAKAERLVADARKDLASIQKEILAEMGGLEKAASGLRISRGKLREAREVAEDKLGSKIGIPEALARVRKAGGELEEISATIRLQVHETTEWSIAQESSERAKRERASLLNDLEETGKDNDARLKELSESISKPVELENLAIAKDSNATKAKQRLHDLQIELETKRKLLPKGEVERDKNVVKLQSETDRAEKVLSESESRLRKKQIEAARTQKRFAEAQVELRKAKLADAADSNKPSKGKGK